MYFPRIIVLLFVALHYAESDIVEQLHETCDGGYCLPRHLCSPEILGQKDPLTLWVGEENKCGDVMKICCKETNGNTRLTEMCGISNPQGLAYNKRSNLPYAKYAEFPWTVAIFQTPSSSKNIELTHIGGGALVHPKFVLTAAHTMEDSASHRYVARFGEWNMKSEAEIYPAQDIEIEEHIPHPDYKKTWTLENDIALVVLKENVIYSDHIRPLCLPSAPDVFDGQKCISAGWGWDLRTGQPASIMKRIELNVLPRGRCEMLFQMMGLSYSLHSSVMCASPAVDQNTCIKDDGSPLACQRDDGSYVLAGIASWVVDCNFPSLPSGHVDVAKFVSWVHDTMKRYDDDDTEEDPKKIKPVIVIPVR